MSSTPLMSSISQYSEFSVSWGRRAKAGKVDRACRAGETAETAASKKIDSIFLDLNA